MESLLAPVLFAAAAAAPAEPATLDLRCFQLMAQLAEDEDPRIRSTGRIAAQYFLGRLDAASPGADLQSLPRPAGAEREALLRRCGDAMQAGGRDFRAIGQALAPASRTAS